MATHYRRHLERLQRGEHLEVNTVLALCERVKDLLVEDDNVVHVASPVAVCGDIHGQFHDLLELFKLAGQAPDTSYVFLGDFVDRGAMSIETISLLCVLKVCYSDRITLLRGNHESRQTTQVYGFQIECMKKYDGDARIYKAFMELFDFLPLGALIDNSLLCLHGGLSPALHHLDQLRMLNRFQEIPPDGIFADIVWSDPDAKTLGFHMSPRGAGYIFGEDVVKKFLHMNKLAHMARAHQLCMEGYQVLFRDTFSTVWSAPNYCHRFGNLAAVMAVDEHLERTYKTFKEAPSSRNIGVLDNSKGTSSDAIDAGYFTWNVAWEKRIAHHSQGQYASQLELIATIVYANDIVRIVRAVWVRQLEKYYKDWSVSFGQVDPLVQVGLLRRSIGGDQPPAAKSLNPKLGCCDFYNLISNVLADVYMA